MSPRGAPGVGAPVSVPADVAHLGWLADVVQVPVDGAWPRHMSGAHPDAVGSYGPGAVGLVAQVLGRAPRWWVVLALHRVLEHDPAGMLVWRQVLLTAPRRVGKSVVLMGLALWRMVYGPALFGEPQLVMHIGKDLPIVREVQSKAWGFASARGWAVSRANGKEAIEAGPEARWLARAKDGVYGYDVTLGIADEVWDIPAPAIDEGLEPATLERISPQLVLASTAHRRATATMRRRMGAALAEIAQGPAGDTLVLAWGADPEADAGDPGVWRGASPFWSADRAAWMATKYARALAGEADPEAEDPDPTEAFRAQYLNVWPGALVKRAPGDPVISAAAWAAAEDRCAPQGEPVAAVAVESWWTSGACVAVATRDATGGVHVSLTAHARLDDAAAHVAALGADLVVAGESLAGDPRFAGATPVRMWARHAAGELARMLGAGEFTHDGTEELTRQVLALRTLPGSDGPRLVSKERTDAVKALVWAVQHARMEAPAIY
jgi:hypothetical protein